MFMSYGRESEEAKEQWQIKVLPNQKDSVRPSPFLSGWNFV